MPRASHSFSLLKASRWEGVAKETCNPFTWLPSWNQERRRQESQGSQGQAKSKPRRPSSNFSSSNRPPPLGHSVPRYLVSLLSTFSTNRWRPLLSWLTLTIASADNNLLCLLLGPKESEQSPFKADLTLTEPNRTKPGQSSTTQYTPNIGISIVFPTPSTRRRNRADKADHHSAIALPKVERTEGSVTIHYRIYVIYRLVQAGPPSTYQHSDFHHKHQLPSYRNSKSTLIERYDHHVPSSAFRPWPLLGRSSFPDAEFFVFLSAKAWGSSFAWLIP